MNTLNDMQQQAVLHTEGPLLILAGAGSGKTRVLTHRIAYLIEEKGVNPWNIMAITFTNKAAGEMKERVNQLIEFGGESVWVSTFHSSCVRILRRHIDRIGYDTNFTIYDADDQKTAMKQVIKELNLDPKIYKEKNVLGHISSAKDELKTPDMMEVDAGADFFLRNVAKCYRHYQAYLKKNNALDFDDLIMKTVDLFRCCTDVLEYYQKRFQYIMVDEYQDTNTSQFAFIELLASGSRNICVVGDDDQSIYKFRGANIKNILNFEQAFPGAAVIKLEQNYRSTQTILDAANEVIRNNLGRKDKSLWTDNGTGEPIILKQLQDGYEEANYVTSIIEQKVGRMGYHYSDFACLYRTNAQSRTLEEKLMYAGIPYKIVGGVNFYQRKEIKDILAYLKTIDSGRDDIALRRIINVPKRGIGETTLSKVEYYANEKGISLYEALTWVEDIPQVARAKAKIEKFTEQIAVLRAKQEMMSLKDLVEEILEQTGYRKELELEGTDEAEGRLENIDELISKVAGYEESADEPNLTEFLEEVALVSDLDSLEENKDYVVLMTIHSAKGLEFPQVFLCGMEDGLFPSYMSMESEDPSDLEEERRLCYVAITRAMKQLYITSARCRMVRGETQYRPLSRFVREIPPLLLDEAPAPRKTSTYSGSVSSGSSYSTSTYNSGSRNVGSASTGFSYKSLNGLNVFDHSSENKKTSPLQKGVPQKLTSLDYGVGDRVSHIKFGEGEVTAIKEGGKDFEVTVMFDKVGQKRLFATFAKLKKL